MLSVGDGKLSHGYLKLVNNFQILDQLHEKQSFNERGPNQLDKRGDLIFNERIPIQNNVVLICRIVLVPNLLI